MIIEINNRTKGKIDLKLVKQVVGEFSRIYPVKSRRNVGSRSEFNGVNQNKEISLAIVGDAAMKKLNRTYRGQNRPTDVLSFAPLNNTEGNLTGQAGDDDLLGEIIIDYAQIKRQAKELGRSIKDELIFILVHGLLHLVGYDDETEKGRREMVKMGEEFVNNFKF